jgi:hypothetical protein
MMENHVSQLQRAMTASSMENTALQQELVRVTKFKDNSFKAGVAEPAVLESSKCPLCLLLHEIMLQLCFVVLRLGDLSEDDLYLGCIHCSCVHYVGLCKILTQNVFGML